MTGDPLDQPLPLGMSAMLVGGLPAEQNTLRRGIAALWHLAMHESLSVTELANRLPCDKSQASRVLKVLAEYGMVQRDPETQRYHLGWLMYAFSVRVSGRHTVSIAGPIVRKLSARTKQSCWVAVLSGNEVLTVYTSRPKSGEIVINEWRGGVEPGGVLPLFCTASGRALLSGEDDDRVDQLLAKATYASAGPNAPRSKAEVLERLAVDRKRGYSITVDELAPGTTSIAAPVRDGVGVPVMAIGLSAKTAKVADRHDALAHEVVLASKHITSMLFAAGENGKARR